MNLKSKMQQMAASERSYCWICNVSFDMEQQYLRHFSTKCHLDMEEIQNRTATMELEVPIEETELQPTSDSTSVTGVQDIVVVFFSPSQVSDECTSIDAAANSADENDTESSEEED